MIKSIINRLLGKRHQEPEMLPHEVVPEILHYLPGDEVSLPYECIVRDGVSAIGRYITTDGEGWVYFKDLSGAKKFRIHVQDFQYGVTNRTLLTRQVDEKLLQSDEYRERLVAFQQSLKELTKRD